MSHSYSSNRIYLIFSTKNREKPISEELPTKLWPYMAGIARIMDLKRSKSVELKITHTRYCFWRRPSLWQGGTNLESMLFEMDKRYKNRGQGLRAAGRVWRFQRARLADWKT
jgi:hypothetical protein